MKTCCGQKMVWHPGGLFWECLICGVCIQSTVEELRQRRSDEMNRQTCVTTEAKEKTECRPS